jgi:hypothetical protein
MADSFILRVMRMIVDEFRTIPGLGYAGLDLQGFQQLPKSRYPAVYVSHGSGGRSESQPSERQRAELPLLITGYVLVPGATPDGITDLREALYQSVENALLGAGLRQRFQDDFLAFGQQVLPLEIDSLPDTDEGQTPPFGYFLLPVRAVLHYPRGGL